MRLPRGQEGRRLGAALLLVATFTFAVGGLAQAAITPTGTATNLANAIATDPSVITGASFVAVPSEGTPNAVADSGTALGGFPSAGSTYAILTSGDPNLADDPNSSASSGVDLNGPNVRGDTDQDVTILKVDLSVPTGRNCLTFDFRFLSEEFPEFVGTDFNDAFIAELDSSTWTTSGSSITAPNNFAADPNGNVISINAAGAASMSAGEAAGTTYDGATPLLSASSPITAGAHSLYLSIFDQGDGIYDSAVFLDALVVGTSAAGACKAGATVLTTVKTADSPTTVAGGTNGYSITVSNSSASAASLNSIFDILPTGFAYVSGSTTGATTANPGIVGQTLTWAGPFNVPAGGSVNLQFDVIVSSVPGEYFNDAGGEAAAGAVSPTGPTAKIIVTGVTTGSADIAVTKTDSPDPVQVGQELTYVITVSNAGPDAAQNVSVSDPLPGTVTYVSAVASQGSCSGTATVSCSLGTIVSGASATVTIKVVPTTDADLTNTATATSTTADPAPANNSDIEATVVDPCVVGPPQTTTTTTTLEESTTTSSTPDDSTTTSTSDASSTTTSSAEESTTTSTTPDDSTTTSTSDASSTTTSSAEESTTTSTSATPNECPPPPPAPNNPPTNIPPTNNPTPVDGPIVNTGVDVAAARGEVSSGPPSVLGIQAVAPVAQVTNPSTSALPFTGTMSTALALVAASLAGLGLLMLLAARPERERGTSSPWSW